MAGCDGQCRSGSLIRSRGSCRWFGEYHRESYESASLCARLLFWGCETTGPGNCVHLQQMGMTSCKFRRSSTLPATHAPGWMLGKLVLCGKLRTSERPTLGRRVCLCCVKP